MHTLKRLVAQGVVDALRNQEHVVVAPGSHRALADEVEDVITPLLDAVTAKVKDAARMSRIATTAMEQLAGQVAEQLLESGNIDDIFAEDRLIRRDTYRAARHVLLQYVEGELDVADAAKRTGECTIELDNLGYVVATVALQADEVLIEGGLLRAATTCNVNLTSVDLKARLATFTSERPIPTLPLEEAITEALTNLVRADLVDLPSVEQVLEVSANTRNCPGFQTALTEAAITAEERTGCLTWCDMVDENTLLASLTPLCSEDAKKAAAHFLTSVAILEARLCALEADSKPPPQQTRKGRSSTVRTKKNTSRKPAQKRKKKTQATTRTPKQSTKRSTPKRNAAQRKKTSSNALLAAFPRANRR